MSRQINTLAVISTLLFILCACNKPVVPAQYTESNLVAEIYPDFQDVTMPQNMAPATFHIDNDAEDYVTRLSSGNVNIVIGGVDVCPTEAEWQELKQAGADIKVEMFLQEKGKWTLMKPFHIYISEDSIDPYLAYRLISPSYVTYEDLTIKQRCLENYKEETIYGNMSNTTEADGQCINCHAFQNGNPDRMQFHCRQSMGGTVIAYDGKIEKVDMKNEGLISAGVYPAWHPQEALIAYSVNKTGQSFHTIHKDKIEVQDQYSDLILYDVKENKVYPLESDSMQLDCFPAWSPDGKYLYYCSARYTPTDSTQTREIDIIRNFEKLHYNLYRRSFDLKSKTFGQQEMVYDCGDTLSATLPRISPDGKYLMFTLAKYGVFHIWHSDSELMLMNLADGSVRNLHEANSDDVDSYHNWSSNGKWVVFSTRREDGNYTRPYFTHMNTDGTFTKATPLPTQEPQYHRDLLRSYNVPEFILDRVSISPQTFTSEIKKEAKHAKI